jgi:hypothetical protein
MARWCDRSRRVALGIAPLAVLFMLGACDSIAGGQLLGGDAAVGGGSAGGVVGSAMRPQNEPCRQAGTFAFAGQATMEQLGLGDGVSSVDASRPGMIWVTRDPVDVGRSLSRAAGFEPDVSRFACVEWADGNGLAIAIEDSWNAPPLGLGDPAANGGLVGDVPTPLIVLLLAGALLAGISYLAFSRPGRPT